MIRKYAAYVRKRRNYEYKWTDMLFDTKLLTFRHVFEICKGTSFGELHIQCMYEAIVFKYHKCYFRTNWIIILYKYVISKYQFYLFNLILIIVMCFKYYKLKCICISIITFMIWKKKTFCLLSSFYQIQLITQSKWYRTYYSCSQGGGEGGRGNLPLPPEFQK